MARRALRFVPFAGLVVGFVVLAALGGVGTVDDTESSRTAAAAPSLRSLDDDDLDLLLSVTECSSATSPGQPPYMTVLQWSVQARPLLDPYLRRSRNGRWIYDGTRLDFHLERAILDASGNAESVRSQGVTGDWMTIDQKADTPPGTTVRYRLSLDGTNLRTAYLFDKLDGSPYPHETCQQLGRGDYAMTPAAAASGNEVPREGWKRP